MKFSVVTYHLPHPDGTATGRHVFAVWDEIRAMGHDVEAWCWGRPPDGIEPPAWVRCASYHDPGGWRAWPRTLRRPRGGLADVGWMPPPDAVVWAEEPESYAAVDGAARTGVTIYHSERLDAVALRRARPAVIQSMRAERRVVRAAGVTITFSQRVARAVGADEICPVTLPIPEQPVALVAEPTAVMIADWAWLPNQVALGHLLRSWPAVRAKVPNARLLLAGRGMTSPPHGAGVVVLGEVATARDVLSQAAVFVFPCPATSGPKMKVLDALAHGVPVVTTPAGVEGLSGVEDAVAVASRTEFAQAVIDVLRDPARQAVMAERGRRAALDHHAPRRAALARLALAERL